MFRNMNLGWTLLDSETHTLVGQYEFRPGSTACAFATRFADDELLVASPPVGFSDADHQKLTEHGRVTAIIAPNGMHYLGVQPLLEAFPEATVYAPERAAARISKKLPKVEIRPLAELAERANGNARVLDVPGFSIGETWVSVKTSSGPCWYVSDSCFNMAEVPKSVPGLLLKWTKTAPGLRLNGIGTLFFLKDKPGYRQWFEQRFAEGEPSLLVPGHGEVYREPNLVQAIRGQLEARL
jgi:hypothetical protein